MIKERKRQIEKQRKHALRELDESMRHQIPGSFGCHEALHTSYVMMDTFEKHVVEHPAIIRDKKWFRKAAKIHYKMLGLYSTIGKKHL